MNETLEYARKYLEKGFSVIPLRPRDKKPVIPWEEYQTRRATENELQQWFGNGANYNIGIVTGRISGLSVVDLDSPEAIDYAKNNNFPKTPLQCTGKGHHLLYSYKEGTRNFQKRDDLPGIDLRSDGGYIVAAPSIHPSGKRYAFKEGYSLDDLPLAELPEIILVKKPVDKKPIAELYKGSPEGNRNNDLARLVGSWANDELTFEQCMIQAGIWNTQNRAPLPEKELEQTIKSILKRHQQEKTNTKTISINPIEHLKKGSELQLIDIKIEWVIDKLLPRQSITLFHGKGGIGKTWLSLGLSKAVSLGHSFLNQNTIQMPVIYSDHENPYPALIDRVKRLDITEVFFWHPCTGTEPPPKLDSPEWIAYKDAPNNALLIFDTLRSSQLKDENDSRAMADIMNRLKELRDKGFTILLLHHTPKGNDRTYKGSTAIFDLCDHVLSLHKVKKTNLDTEIDDDEETDCFYRFGTKDKTRYEPYHLFLQFNPECGFEIAPDPDNETLKAIHEHLREAGTLNQKDVYEWCKDNLDIKGKAKVVNLMRKGTGPYWTVDTGGKNARLYSAVQLSPTIYTGQQDNTNQVSRKNRTTENYDSYETPESPMVSSCPEYCRTAQTTEAEALTVGDEWEVEE